MDCECLRCNNLLGEDYQLIFDETGIELRLDTLLAEYFEIFIKQEPNLMQALCAKCVNELIELFDLSQKSQEIQPPPEKEKIDMQIKEEEELIIEPAELEIGSGHEQKFEIDEDSNSVNIKDGFMGFEESEESLTSFENVQYLEEFESITPQKYIHEVIKSELQEITYEQTTVCRLCDEVLKSHTAVLMHASTNHESSFKTYPCLICDKVGYFDSIRDLAHHIVLKHYDLEIVNIYCTCPECEKRFVSFIEYNKHSCYSHKAIDRLRQECSTCLKEFTSNKRYRFHLQFHLDKRRPKACFICDILFSDENDFFEHIMYAHEKDTDFICKKCDRVCTSKKTYDNHLKLHNVVRMYGCDYCSKSYMYKQMLTDHIIRHHSKKQANKCKICMKSLASKHILTRHMQLKHLKETEETVYACSLCGLVGGTEKDLRDHADTVCSNAELTSERLKIAYACEFCELAYNSTKNLKSHRKIHVDKQYLCWICQSPYPEFKKLKTHVITHKQYDPIQKTFPINRHYVCDLESCHQSYLTWPSLRTHKRRHVIDAKFTCEVCNRTFRSHSQLNSHLKAHENNEEYPCQFCAKLCCSQMSLSVHIARKHNNNCKSCPTCKATYNNEEALNEHIKTNHVKQKCQYCGKITKNKRNLEIHIQMIHIKVKRYFCSICTKGYYNASDLKVHERAAHAEPKKFKCPHCDFSSSYEASFNAHCLLHESKKPFKCEVCSREFTRKTCFKLHVLRHSDVKPFTCPVDDCGRCFVTRGVLNSHLRDNHSDRETTIKRASPQPPPKEQKRLSPSEYAIMEVMNDEAISFEEANAEEEILLEYVDEIVDFD